MSSVDNKYYIIGISIGTVALAISVVAVILNVIGGGDDNTSEKISTTSADGNTVDLGSSEARLNDIYLSGTLNGMISLDDTDKKIKPSETNTYDLGSSDNKFKDLYLSGRFNNDGVQISPTTVLPTTSDAVDLGSSDNKFNHLYLSGTLNGCSISAENEQTAKINGLEITHNQYDLIMSASTSNSSSGNKNTVYGISASAGSGNHNTSIGYQAMSNDALTTVSGNYNVCVGARSGSLISEGSQNVQIGGFSPGQVDNIDDDDGIFGGSYNTLIGVKSNVEGSTTNIINYSIAIGYGAKADSSNQMVIGSLGSWAITQVVPGNTNKTDLGTTVKQFKNLYLSGSANVRSLTTSGDVTIGTAIVPAIDNSVNLGVNTQRWRDIYSVNPVTTSSDMNLKKDIVDSDLGLNFINRLRPVKYKFKQNESDRPHYGLIAQEVRDVLTNLKQDFAGYCYADAKKVSVTDEETREIDEKIEELSEPFYGLRYTEFISPMLKAIQELSTTVNELKAEVAILKAKIN